MTGTDEHGQKVQQSAEKNDVSPQEWCDRNSQAFRDLIEVMNFSNDDFIRTTEQRHKVGSLPSHPMPSAIGSARLT